MPCPGSKGSRNWSARPAGLPASTHQDSIQKSAAAAQHPPKLNPLPTKRVSCERPPSAAPSSAAARWSSLTGALSRHWQGGWRVAGGVALLPCGARCLRRAWEWVLPSEGGASLHRSACQASLLAARSTVPPAQLFLSAKQTPKRGPRPQPPHNHHHQTHQGTQRGQLRQAGRQVRALCERQALDAGQAQQRAVAVGRVGVCRAGRRRARGWAVRQEPAAGAGSGRTAAARRRCVALKPWGTSIGHSLV